MQDKPVDLGSVVAYVLWGAAVAVALWSIDGRDVYLATIACILTGGAVTATIRCYFVASNRMIRNAFELGRDSAAVPMQRVH